MSDSQSQSQEEDMSTTTERALSISKPSIFSARMNHGGESFESFQEMHSLLLCPSQWTALLESPVSLVRNKTDPGSEEDTLGDDASLNDESTVNDIQNVPTETEGLV